MTDCSEGILCPTYRNAMVKDIQTEFSISHVLTSCCRACLWYRVSESSEKTITKYSWFIFRMHDLTQTPHWSQWWNYTMKGRICSLDQKTHAYFLRSWRLRSTNRSLVLYVILCEFETQLALVKGQNTMLGLRPHCQLHILIYLQQSRVLYPIGSNSNNAFSSRPIRIYEHVC